MERETGLEPGRNTGIGVQCEFAACDVLCDDNLLSGGRGEATLKAAAAEIVAPCRCGARFAWGQPAPAPGLCSARRAAQAANVGRCGVAPAAFCR